MKKIALVGSPNVGKSTLFNRLTKSYDAITSKEAGTTRDIRRGVAVINDQEVMLFDTGGLENRDEMFVKVRQNSLDQAKDADLVLFMVDGQMMPSDEEKKLFFEIQAQNSEIVLVLNKIDNEKLKAQIFEYMSFGAKDIFAISCAHKRGIDELTDYIARLFEFEEMVEDSDDFFDEYDDDGEFIGEMTSEADQVADQEDDLLKIAIIGRPNVGKSALLNALVGFDRSVVSSIAGTTIDPVDEEVVIDDQRIRFVDTAGIRRRSRILGIERFAFDRTEKMLQNANLALIVLDSSDELTELDEKIAGLVDKHNLASIIVLNKYDITEKSHKELEKEIRAKFRFLEYTPLITISATSKKRIHKLKELIFEVYQNYQMRIPTSKLNELIKDATIKHQLPSDKGKIVKIYYATQYDTKPPQIALISNRPRSIHFSYVRYLINTIRDNFKLIGTPIVLKVRARKKEEELQTDE